MPKKEKPNFNKDDHQADVLDLLRKILEGVELQSITDLDGLQGQARGEFLKYCSQMTDNPWFLQIMNMLVAKSVEAAALKADNYDIVTFNRATANGISMVKEYFQKMNKRYAEEYEKKDKDFNPQEPFSKTETDQFFKI